jgi:hypothetical protein
MAVMKPSMFRGTLAVYTNDGMAEYKQDGDTYFAIYENGDMEIQITTPQKVVYLKERYWNAYTIKD